MPTPTAATARALDFPRAFRQHYAPARTPRLPAWVWRIWGWL